MMHSFPSLLYWRWVDTVSFSWLMRSSMVSVCLVEYASACQNPRVDGVHEQLRMWLDVASMNLES